MMMNIDFIYGSAAETEMDSLIPLFSGFGSSHFLFSYLCCFTDLEDGLGVGWMGWGGGGSLSYLRLETACQ